MSLADYIENKPILETQRLTLRTMTAADADDLREWTPNKTLYKYWGKNPGKADKNPELLFTAPKKPTKSFHWGIVLKAENKVIGEAWVYLIENDRMANVAVCLSEKYHGQGLATEALKEIVRFCFEKTELQRLWTGADVRNTPSIRMLKRRALPARGLSVRARWCPLGAITTFMGY